MLKKLTLKNGEDIIVNLNDVRWIEADKDGGAVLHFASGPTLEVQESLKDFDTE